MEKTKYAQAQAIKAKNYVAPKVAPLIGFCLECNITQLILECPCNPMLNQKASLEVVDISPPPSSGSNIGKVVLLNAVTRAQNLKDIEVQRDESKSPITAESSTSSWKAWKEQRFGTQKCEEKKANENAKVQERNEKPKEGFEKVLDPLKGMLDA